jgi:hypothetical protein
MTRQNFGVALLNWLSKPFRYLRQNRKAQFVFFLSLISFPLFIFVIAVVLPVAKNPFEASVESEALETSEALPDSTPAEIVTGRRELAQKMAALEINQAFLQTRLELSKQDSICLVVDLLDSTASLEVRGVPMRRCKILRFRSSGLARRLRNQGRLHQWLAAPFILQEQLATLPKAPIRIKEAPRDTIEASESKGEDLPIEQRDAEFTLHFDRNLTLSVEQAQPPSFSGRLRELWYDLRRNFNEARDAVAALMHLQLPQHRLWIEIELSREDAKAIYRALPTQAGLALRL